jgi:hypothetical protein
MIDKSVFGLYRHVIVCTCCDLLLCIVITQVPEDRTGVYGTYEHYMQHANGHILVSVMLNI